MNRIFFSVEDIEQRQKQGLIATENFHAYSSYIYDPVQKQYTIDSSWWQEQPDFIQRNILDTIQAQPDFSQIILPHNFKRTAATIKIYTAFVQSYDYEYWHSSVLHPDVTILPLSGEEKTILYDVTSSRLENKLPYSDFPPGTDPDRISGTSQLLSLRKRIDAVTNPNVEYFIRLSGTSAKKDHQLAGLKKSRKIMDHLTNSFSFLTQEYCHPTKRTSVIIIPWNSAIKPRNEFRVFIHNKQVTAIAPQRWYNSYIYTPEEIDIIEESILQSRFWDHVPYASLVADVWVELPTKTAHLIECNPFGIFGPSGSSLFSWKEDYAILYGKNKPEIRLRK